MHIELIIPANASLQSRLVYITAQVMCAALCDVCDGPWPSLCTLAAICAIAKKFNHSNYSYRIPLS